MKSLEQTDSSVRQVSCFVNGKLWAPSPNLSEYTLNYPATGEVSATVIEGDATVVDAAVQAAKAAMKGPWGKTDAAQRADMLYKIAEGIEARFDEFLAAEIRDTGKPISMASKIDIPRGAANFKVFADIIRSASAETFQMKSADGHDVLNYALRLPKGVVGVICPWNLPLLLMTWKVAPALACGNAVVVKPSEQTPSTAVLLGEVMRDAGLPDGVYNVVNGFGAGSAGELITNHPDVDAITFTGETRTGEAIMRAAATGVRDVSFELGGKNPGLIFADCDLDKAVESAAKAVFVNCGQVCLQTERIYVERTIFDAFVEKLKLKAESLLPGDPLDRATSIGPLISQEHRKKVLSFYEKARAEGATEVTGGDIFDMPGAFAGGNWIKPTLWTGLPETSPVVTEEIFGPCAHITPFDSDDEALAMANNTRYGLASMVWTENLSRAHRVASQLETGICWVNSWFLRDLRTPFGGSKSSGIGREGGLHSLEFYSELRNVCIQL
ncbi:MAG: 2-hydroxymuconic semialdehyde dehydrogenase [Ponticaulis sp.]|nr:2-hydroxymuconic semialdehyde dehydrogenase [Ponticaulis sp.]